MSDAVVDAGLPFRPESLDHFKEVAKSLSGYLGVSLQKSQECLSRIYGYESLHELQENLKRPGDPGPYLFGYTSSKAQHTRCIEVISTFLGDQPVSLAGRAELMEQIGLFQREEVPREGFKALKRLTGTRKGGGEWPSPTLSSWLDELFYLPREYDSTPLQTLGIYSSGQFQHESADPTEMVEALRNAVEPLIYRQIGPVSLDGKPHPDLPAGNGSYFDYLDDPVWVFNKRIETANADLMEYVGEVLVKKYLGEKEEEFWNSLEDEPSSDHESEANKLLSAVPDGQRLKNQWLTAYAQAIAQEVSERRSPVEVLHEISSAPESLRHLGSRMDVFIHIGESDNGQLWREMDDMQLWSYCASFWITGDAEKPTPIGVMRGRLVIPFKQGYRVHPENFQHFMDADSAMLNDVWKALQFDYFPRRGFRSVTDFCKENPCSSIVTAHIELLPEFRGNRITPHLLNLFAGALEGYPYSAYASAWPSPHCFDADEPDCLENDRYIETMGMELHKPAVFVFPVEGTEPAKLSMSPLNVLLATSPTKVKRQVDPVIEKKRASQASYFESLTTHIDADVLTYDPWEYPLT